LYRFSSVVVFFITSILYRKDLNYVVR